MFRKLGYHNVGINDILKACNIPKGSFYNFFESKEEFAEQVLEYFGEYNLEKIGALQEASYLRAIEKRQALGARKIENFPEKLYA